MIVLRFLHDTTDLCAGKALLLSPPSPAVLFPALKTALYFLPGPRSEDRVALLLRAPSASEAAKQTLHIKKTAVFPAVFLMRFLSRHPDLIQAVTQDIVDLYLFVQPRMFLDPFVVL